MDSRKPLTAGEIEEIREMRAKATPGPVEFCIYGSKDKAWLKRELCNLVDSSPGAELYFVGTPDGLVVALTGNGPTSKDNARFLAVMLNEFDRLLSMLTPPPDAAVREAVEHLSSGWGESAAASRFKGHVYTLIRAVQAPRLTTEQVDYLRQMDAHFEHTGTDGFRNGLRLYWPEAFAGEVGNE